jgi:nucleoside-diphosphate-sugar epimerase
MKVFVAGASGTIGVPLTRALVAAGHDVTALTRSPDKQSMLSALGATPVVADALDADALRRVVVSARPTHVIHQLTALPKTGVRSARELSPTNRLRIDGTRNLVAAAVAAGAQRIIGGSFALLQGATPGLPPEVQEGADALQSMESQILEASRAGRIEGVVLRYGLFYSFDTPSTQQMITLLRRRFLPTVRGDRSLLPSIHVDDAVSATILALDRAPNGGVYDIVDDQPSSFSDIVTALAQSVGAPRPIAVPAWLPRLVAPYMARMLALRLPLSNAKAKADLGWKPAFPTVRDGLSSTVRRAA